MAKKLVFSLEFEGSQQTTTKLTAVETNLGRVTKEINGTKKAIAEYNKATAEQRAELEKNGKGINQLETNFKSLRSQQVGLREEARGLRNDLKDQAKEFLAVEKTIPKDSLVGLRIEYKKLRSEIDLMGAAARASVEGLEKIEKAEGIKRTIDSIGESVGDFRSQVGSYVKAVQQAFETFKGGGSGGSGGAGSLGAIIDPLASILGGGLVGGEGIIELLGQAGTALGPVGVAITATIGGFAALTQHVIDTTLAYEKQFDQVTSLTGVTGLELVEATGKLSAISQVYNADQKEILLAANALSRELGGPLTKSLDLVRSGLQQNADANGEYLDGIREYSAQVRDAEISAERFNQILIDQTQLGVFSDKGIDAVKEATELIGRLEDKALTGLDRLGIDSQQTAEDLAGGYVTVAEVIGQAATAIRELPKESIIARKATDEIFGTPGIDAGRAFIETLSDLGEESIRVEQELTPYQNRLEAAFQATLALEEQNTRLAATFAGLETNVEGFGTRLQTFGTKALNDFIELFVVNRRIIEDDGFFSALLSGQERYNEEAAEFAKENADALASIKEGQEEAAIGIRAAALAGTLSLRELRQEQAKIKDEIDAARAAGLPLTDLQNDLVTINENIAEAMKAFNVTLEDTSSKIKEVAEEGSIEALGDKVKELQDKITTSSPNNALKLIQDLQNAELDLSAAQKEIDDFKEEVRLANVESLPIEDQIEIYEGVINKRRELDIQYATSRLTSERELNAELAAINLEADIESLENSLRGLEEGSSEALKVINDINSAKESLGDLEIKIELIQSEEAIAEAARITQTALEEAFTNEEELQDRLNLLKTNTTIANLQERLRLEQLSAEERFNLETELLARLKTQKDEQARVDIDFEGRLNTIDDQEAQDQNAAVPTFDPNNIEGSLAAIKAFEDAKTQITLEAQIERFELEKELRIAQGQDTIDIDTQIAEAKLALDQKTNKALIDNQKKRLKETQKEEKRNLKITEDTFEAVGKLVGSAFASSLDSAEDANKEFINLMLDTVEKVIQLQIAAVIAREIGSKSFIGVATGALLSGLIGAAFAVAKNAISSEEGNILEKGGLSTPSQDLKGGNIFKGKSHSQGGSKFFVQSKGRRVLNEAEKGEAIVNKKSTSKWAGLLSAINEDEGGKRFSPDSGRYKGLLARMDVQKFADGDITGAQVGSQFNVPQLVNPQAVIVVRSTLNPADMEIFAEIVAERQAAILTPIVNSIPEKVSEGTEETTRLRERQQIAEENSVI